MLYACTSIKKWKMILPYTNKKTCITFFIILIIFLQTFNNLNERKWKTYKITEHQVKKTQEREKELILANYFFLNKIVVLIFNHTIQTMTHQILNARFPLRSN